MRKPSPWRRLGRLLWRGILGFFALSLGLTLALRFLPVPVSGLMVERRIESWFDNRAYAPRYDWVSLDQMAPVLGAAVIAAEDQKFAEHFGFDWAAIEKAVAHNERHKRMRGASTLSQQTAKNLFLWSERSWLRKGLEAYFTLALESCWSKRRILEVYLNIVEFGPGIYGAEAAAQRFFRKPAARLSPAEAALLAAVLPNPRRFRADAPSAYVRQRQAWILRQMRQLGGPALVRGL
ncbi:MAG: monofunctional biosynthetic peptidoglycan transglycosylase [Gammaproteobacteria bacterium]|nr:monofunctional biosynthetic peptidoglycan transglycosylase [Gammaproteobacteria bacterium]